MTSLIRKAHASPAGDDPLTYVMSDETVDRMGDVIAASGWLLDNFAKNPVALFAHDHRFVIGSWSDVRVQGRKLIGRLNLLPKGISERLDEIRSAVAAGVLRAVSVGFRADPDDVEPSKTGGVRFRRAELMECSLVSVPANPNALQIAKSLNLSAEAKALIFGGVGRVPSGHRVVRLSPVARAHLNGTLTIKAPPLRPFGDHFVVRKIKRVGTKVVRLPPEEVARLNPPSGPTKQVRLTQRDFARAKAKVVKL